MKISSPGRLPRFLAFYFLPLFLSAAHAAEANPLLTSWLAGQTNVQTWSADLVQTRTLKTIAQPLVARGHIWFSAPNLFRWELGAPAQTIAVREPGQMLVLYPRLKRGERYPLDNLAPGPMRELLTLIEVGFPRDQADLESRFKILSVELKGDAGEIRLQPKSATARKFMPELKMILDVKNSHPLATEMKFADGSTMRNDFTNAVVNQKLEAALFKPEAPADFKISEPLQKQPGP